MKIIFTATAGKLDFYLEDYAAALARCGNDVKFVPLSTFLHKPFYRFWESGDGFTCRTLEKTLAGEKCDVLICNFSSLRFDFPRIRSFFKGKIVLYDMEGPNFRGFRDLSALDGVDLIVTVSRVMAEKLNAAGKSAVYIPHAVECSRFKPVKLSAADEKIFCRKSIFIGRPSPHRIQFLQAFADRGGDLTLYGKQWHREKIAESAAVPFQTNITGEELLKAVSGAGFAVNILQDQFLEYRTLMNLQIFFYAALGCPLLTEFVEELPECFEEGREMYFFRDQEEFLDKAQQLSGSPELCAVMGKAAQERVFKAHTLDHRALVFDRYLREL